LSGATNGSQKEDKNLLQRSKLRHRDELWHISVSTGQQSWWCGQNLCGPSYTANDCLIRHSSNGKQQEEKRAQNSTTKVSFCTIILGLSQYTMVIMTVWSRAFPVSNKVSSLNLFKHTITLHYVAQYFSTRSV